NNSLRKSVVDAEDAFNKKAANAQLAGAVVGAGARYGLRNVGSLNFNSSTVDGVSTVKPISTYDFNSNPDGTMVS
ncbi:hypothetical protein ACPV5G_21870, partial [Photobacterium damselae]